MNKVCQNCKKEFVIDQNDQNYYDKIKVPFPTWCGECRMMRRFAFMNIYSLYKRECDKCGETTISMYSKDHSVTVYCSACWWGGDWDGFDYGIDYDPDRSFFEQVKELIDKTPFMALDTQYQTLIRSSFTNYASNIKDCYGVFYADYCENTVYSEFLNGLNLSSDCLQAFGSELCYGSVGIRKSSMLVSCLECESCVSLFFSKNCAGCTDCFGCMNLRNKSYCIYNKQYAREDYLEFIKNAKLNIHENYIKYKNECEDFWSKNINKEYYGNSLNANVSGNYIYESKNAHDVYLVTGVEDSRYIQFMTVPTTKNCYDYTCWGQNAENVYETLIAGHGANNIKFTIGAYPDCLNQEYCYYSSGSKDCFGCVNLRKKQYCILNKEYSKEEYEKLKNQIIENMKMVGEYGEFFPMNFSHFGYNETLANDYFPKNKEEVLNNKITWYDKKINIYDETIKAENLPNQAEDFEKIESEIIKCDCGKCYRIIENEFLVLQKLNLPLPRSCPDCRRAERFAKVLPPKLYDRSCDKCGKEIRMAYEPGLPEIVYCESCYTQEIA